MGMIFPSEIWLKLLSESAQRTAHAHEQFLKQRSAGLSGLHTLIAMQMGSENATRPALFTSEQLDAFGTGKISDCMGPDFREYDELLLPRIPNGALKMMSRVVMVEATRRRPDLPTKVEVEYDVPRDAWYLQENPSGVVPHAAWMEIALQPCGFLSAYLDTYAFLSNLRQGRFFFRNLDGAMDWLGELPGAAETILTRAELTAHVVSGETVIQKFRFEMSAQGRIFATGSASFGYFSAKAMETSAGLDTGQGRAPWLRQVNEAQGAWLNLDALRQVDPHRPAYHLASGRMNWLDTAFLMQAGGQHGMGYVCAQRALHPQDWFYPLHFYKDPVMPGSLGIEALIQALQVYALGCDLGRDLQFPAFQIAGPQMEWRYRGQIVPSHQQIEVEVHITHLERTAQGIDIQAEGSLWADGLRIYEAKGLALRLAEQGS